MNRTSNVRLYGAIFGVSWWYFTTGISCSWSSPVLLKLNGKVDPENNPFEVPITTLQESWIASLINIGALFGSALSGLAIDKIGRKNTLLVISVPMITSYLITAFARAPEYFYVARFLVGIGTGTVFAICPLYIGEISEKHNRGRLICFAGINCCIGSTVCFCIGPYLTVKALSLLSIVPMCISVVPFAMLVPESPYYYLITGQEDKARASLKTLRGGTNVVKELTEMSRDVENSIRNKPKIRTVFKNRPIVKGLTIYFGMVFFQQVSGITIMANYLQSIFEMAGGSVSSDVATNIVGVLQLVATVVASLLVDKLGRKVLLYVSLISMLIAHGGLGGYFYMKDNRSDIVADVSWLPISSILLYIIGWNLGLGPVTGALLGELFPPNFKATATSITSIASTFLAFLSTILFPIATEAVGMGAVFWVFSVCCGAAVVFVAVVVPETKGKSLQEIQEILEEEPK